MKTLNDWYSLSNNERIFVQKVNISNESELDVINIENELPEELDFIVSTGEKTWAVTKKFTTLDDLSSQ